MSFNWDKYGHTALWALVAVVGLVIIAGYFGWILSAIVAEIIIFGIIAALVFALDWHTVKMLSSTGLQFAAAILLAVITGFISSHSLGMNLFLRLADIVIVMCIFSVSASIWHNSEAIAERLSKVGDAKDMVDAIRDGASAGADALKRGVDSTVAETKRTVDHFKSS